MTITVGASTNIWRNVKIFRCDPYLPLNWYGVTIGQTDSNNADTDGIT